MDISSREYLPAGTLVQGLLKFEAAVDYCLQEVSLDFLEGVAFD